MVLEKNSVLCLKFDVKLYISVFPTHVGVFLTNSEIKISLGSFPHACGGVSQQALL